eukprot:COSAG02_NODE_1997_length_10152_cov_3.110315_5_plen_943_part_00
MRTHPCLDNAYRFLLVWTPDTVFNCVLVRHASRCFYVDIILNFCTGYDKGFEVVMVREEIARNYVGSGWFFVDLIVTVQWDLLIGGASKLFGHSGDMGSLGVLKLIKVVRLGKAPRLILTLTKTWTVHTGVIGAFKFFVLVLIVAHILGCFFFMIPALALDCVPAEYNLPDSGESVYGGVIGDLIESHENAECEGQCGICDPDGAEPPDTIGIIPGGWRHSYGVEQMQHYEQYIDSLYWSLTTMTTIGYGDRGPQLQTEIVYTMCAEIIGLSFFAMLLNQIAVLQEVLGRQQGIANEEKNEVVQFLKHNHLDSALIQEVVQFLNFKTKGHSGHALKESDYRRMEHFRDLSEPLRQKIKEEIFIRPLREVRIFGHSKKDKEDKEDLRRLFDKIDDDKGGSLDQEEIIMLLNSLGIDGVTTEEVTAMMVEMKMHDSDSTTCQSEESNDVTFEQFQSWWYYKKHGRPKMPKCPIVFLEQLASVMSDSLKPYGRNEQVVGAYAQVPKSELEHDNSHQWYGERLAFVMTGTVIIVKNPPRSNDIVTARSSWGRSSQQRLSGFLSRPGQRGRVMPGSVNPILRTCKVFRIDDNDAPCMLSDVSGNAVLDISSYKLVELEVVQRHRPQYYVCDNLRLLAHPREGANSYEPASDDEEDRICDDKGVPLRLGGLVPAKQTVRELLDPNTGKPRRVCAGHREYVLVSWSTDNGQVTGWLHDPLSSKGKESSHDGEVSENEVVRWVEDTKLIDQDDEEPVFGLAAALEDEEFQAVKDKTRGWFVETLNFVDMAYITRKNLRILLNDHWPPASVAEDGLVTSTDGRSPSILSLDLPKVTVPDEDYKMGGQQALAKLALMDHHLIRRSDANEMSGQYLSAGRCSVGDATKSHRLRDIMKNRMKSIINPVTSFEDCAKRFDAIEKSIERVSNNVDKLVDRQTVMQDQIMAELTKRQ